MKATKAYIASLGTTGVLLAAALLLLGVVSAVVAFDRWPDGQVSSRVQTLVLAERPAPIRVTSNGAGVSATAAARAGGLALVPRTNGAGGLVVKRFTGGTRPPGSTPPAAPAVPGLPPAVTKPLEPVTETTSPIIDAVSNPATTATQVA